MTRAVFLATVATLAVGAACGDSDEGSGVTTTSTSSGASTGSSATSGTGASTSAGAGGGATTTTTGSGGSVTCVTCATFYADPSVGTEGLCSTSVSLLEDLTLCICGDAMTDGLCPSDCPVMCGIDPNGDESACETCVTASCGGEYSACIGDEGR